MRALGNKGEDYAVKFLKKQHYTILERNFTVRGGEIDIVAEDDGVLVFVEVKLRKTADFGRPSEYVTSRKREKLIYTARCYMSLHAVKTPCRFDVVELLGGEGAFGRLEIREANLIRNAFLC